MSESEWWRRLLMRCRIDTKTNYISFNEGGGIVTFCYQPNSFYLYILGHRWFWQWKHW